MSLTGFKHDKHHRQIFVRFRGRFFSVLVSVLVDTKLVFQVREKIEKKNNLDRFDIFKLDFKNTFGKLLAFFQLFGTGWFV